jgi:hypothetical protein
MGICGKYLTVYGEFAESIHIEAKDEVRVVCGAQNRLRICGEYLNLFGEYAEVFKCKWRKRHKNLAVFS